MSSSDETVLEVLIWVFVSSGFIGCVGCISALLKKCVDKYGAPMHPSREVTPMHPLFQDVTPMHPSRDVINLPNDEESHHIENVYANATVSIIQEQYQEIDLVEVCICGNDEIVETNIIAEEVMTHPTLKPCIISIIA